MMHCTNAAKKLLQELHTAGYASYLVGGCVRDYLMGKTPHDEDITTSALPEEVESLFSSRYKVIETGLKHGTVTVLVDGVPFEITTMRVESEYSDNRHPDKVEFVRNIKDDLARRDFTINAMAWNESGLVDPFDGKQDLYSRTIRAVGEASKRFQEDALRMMRAVRFSAQFGFMIDIKTKIAIMENAHLIQSISKERIRDEMCKILVSNHPECFRLLHDYGLLQYISKEVDAIFGCEQNNDFHCYDVGEHTMVSVQNIEPDIILRMTMLLHDTGKPLCKVQKNGRDHFYGHPEVSAEIAEKFLNEYRFPKRDSKRIVELVKNHDMVSSLWESRTPEKKVRRFLLEHHEQDDQFFLDFIKVRKADFLAHNQDHPLAPKAQHSIEFLEWMLNQYVGPDRLPRQIKDLNISGKDILAEGVEPKHVGRVQHRLLRIILDHPGKNDRDVLRRYTRTEYKQLLHEIRTSGKE